MRNLIILALCLRLAAADYYVGPSGSSGNAGTLVSPWDVASVCAEGNPKSIAAGDTVKFLAGTYTTTEQNTCYLAGSSGNPIRMQPHETAVVKFDMTGFTPSSSLGAVIAMHPDSAYVIWERSAEGGYFEIMSSDTRREFDSALACYPQCRPDGFSDYGDNNQLRGAIIHDVGVGITSQGSSCNGQYVGNTIYYLGWQYDNNTNVVGNPFYLQGDPACSARKQFTYNVMFTSCQFPEINGSTGSNLSNIDMNYNLSFNHGSVCTWAWGAGGGGLLAGSVGAPTTYQDNSFVGNVAFNSVENQGRFAALKFFENAGALCADCTVQDNYFAILAASAGNSLSLTEAMTGLTESGNIFVGPVEDGSAAAQFPNSTFIATVASESTDRVYRPINADSRWMAVIDGSGDGSVSWTPTNCSAGTSLELREQMNFTTAAPDLVLPCGSAQTIPMAYSGSILPIVAGLPVAPVHTGTLVRTFDVVASTAYRPIRFEVKNNITSATQIRVRTGTAADAITYPAHTQACSNGAICSVVVKTHRSGTTYYRYEFLSAGDAVLATSEVFAVEAL